jgi:predicted phosphoribosyltransferase
VYYQPHFKDRREAGRKLGEILWKFKNDNRVVVLALPRGGVPVGHEVAAALNAPLDVFVVRKLGVPGHEELAFGAIATGGVTVFNEGVLRSLQIPGKLLDSVIETERNELERRERLYREGRPPLDVKGKVVIVVDDGLATGSTMAAAVKSLREIGPSEIVVAVPVASREACEEFELYTKARCICVATPEPFYGVGMWYEDFSQTSDTEVREILNSHQPKELLAKANNKESYEK